MIGGGSQVILNCVKWFVWSFENCCGSYSVIDAGAISVDTRKVVLCEVISVCRHHVCRNVHGMVWWVFGITPDGRDFLDFTWV